MNILAYSALFRHALCILTISEISWLNSMNSGLDELAYAAKYVLFKLIVTDILDSAAAVVVSSTS